MIFTEGYIYGGFYETFKKDFEIIKKFWNFNYHSYFDYLRDIERRECDDPFDINFIQIFVGLILAGYGSIVGVIVFTLMWIVKLFPCIFRMYYEMFKKYCALPCYEIFMFLIFFTIGLCLVPVAGVLSILFYIASGFYGGIACAIEGYKYNIGRGIISIWSTIHKLDELTNKLVFFSKKSCFPDCSQTCKTKKKIPNVKKKKNKSKNEESEIREDNSPTMKNQKEKDIIIKPIINNEKK